MKHKGYLLFLLVVIIAFWQVFFLQNSLKWDFIDAFLPSRYFFSESILNNQFPLWDPYLLYGIPIYADLVSVFNPEFWIISNLFGYSNITLQFIYLAYILIAGISFNFFLKLFKTEKNIALALSIAYMFSGINIGNAQNLAIISGYAILPIVISLYLKFLKDIKLIHFVAFAISLFFMIYGSYPALTIILIYFLFALFIYYFFQNKSNKRYKKDILIYHALLLIIVVLFSSVLLLSFTQVSPFLNQYNGHNLDFIQQHPFSIKSTLSYIFPMASGKDSHFFGTDSSMSNGYFGIFSLILLGFSRIKKPQNKESYIFLFFGIFSLLASFGKDFFLREFLYHYAPLMNMFRYPSIFRAFTIFSFLAYIGINFYQPTLTKPDKNRLTVISSFLILIITFLIFYSKSQVGTSIFFNSNLSFTEKLISADFYESIIFQGIVQLALLSIFLVLLWKSKSSKQFSKFILILFIADGIIATQLSIHNTVINEKNPIAFSKYLKSVPKGFPIPSLNPIRENSDKNAQNNFVWMNENIFPKKVTFDGLVSFKLDGYTKLSDSYPILLDSIKNNALVYLSDDIRSNTNISNFTSKTLFLDSNNLDKLDRNHLKTNNNDQISINHFNPKEIRINTRTTNPQILVYQQNFYKGWSVLIDGQQHELLNVNFTHMAVFLSASKHTVTFIYKNPSIKLAFFFSYFILAILILFFIYLYIKNKPNQKKKTLIIIGISLTLFVIGSLINRSIYKKNKEGLIPDIIQKTSVWKTQYAKINILLSSQNQKLINQVNANKTLYLNDKASLPILSQFLTKSDSKYFAFVWQGTQINNEVLELIYSFYPEIIEKEVDNSSGLLLLKQNTESSEFFDNQNFESSSNSKWNLNPKRIEEDSTNNNHYFIYHGEEWGTSIEVIVDKSILESKQVLILSDILFSSKITELPLVFTVEKENTDNIWEASDINKYIGNTNTWYRTSYIINLQNKLSKGDKIKIYFWNKNHADFRLDNIKIKFLYDK